MQKISFFIIFFTLHSIFSQNLVLNPGFEEYKYCPQSISAFGNNVLNWSAPTIGTTDYFHLCSKIMGFINYNGEQKPKTGQGYAGIYAYASQNYREYVQGELKETLVKDKVYKISYYISLAEKSNHAIKDFGILMVAKTMLSNQSPQVINAKRISEKVSGFNYVPFFSDRFYPDKENWTLITTTYRAQGFEKFFIIGNFNSNSLSKIEKLTDSKYEKFSYYYIDDVSIELAEKEEALNVILDYKIEEIVFENNKIYTFKNVLFDFDKAILLDISKVELDKLSLYLEDNPKTLIEIYGHTDNIGTQKRNEELALERAKSVSEYLILHGLNASRIKWFGFGSSKPVDENDTDEGRSNNRRVEFKLIEL